VSTSPKSTSHPKHGLGIWWMILVLGGVTSVYLNIWHAVHQGPEADKAAGQIVLAVTYGIVPVIFAALLSHGFISPLVGPWPRRVIVALFLIGMAMSLSAQADVMAPYGGPVGSWGIPIILDASALVALHVITKAAATAAQADQARAREAELAAARRKIRAELQAEVRAELEAELAARWRELQAEVERNREAELAAVRAEVRAELRAEQDASQAGLEAELAARQAEAERRFAARLADAEAEIRQSVETETQDRIRRAEVETEARVRLELAKDAKAKTKAKSPEAQAKKAADGLSTKDKARILLAENPAITGAELGRALDVSDRYGRELLGQLIEEQQQAQQTSATEVLLRAVN
jgi:hypothetical protein